MRISIGWAGTTVQCTGWLSRRPIAWPGRFLIDLDYIVGWIDPQGQGGAFEFWVCPSTLVFDDAANLHVSALDFRAAAFELSIDALRRSELDQFERRTWTIDGHGFTATVEAGGFTQYLRSGPIRAARQRLSVDQRGGASFEERGFT